MDTRTLPMFCRLALVAAVLTTACTPTAEYADPPASTYAAASFTVEIPAGRETVIGASISERFFPAANVQPLLGRFFIHEEYQGAGKPVAVLSHEAWQSAFNAQPTVIGSTIQLNGRPTTIVGVAPKGFAKPKDAKVWIPKA